MGNFPNKATQFVPGQSGNPSGKPKDLLTADRVKAVMGRLGDMTADELKALATDPTAKMLEVMVASVMVRCVTDGDYARFNFLLDRQIGKVKDQVEISTPRPYVVEWLDGAITEIGMKLPEKEGEE